jgi:hypothetical protein|tara:strand:+ start:1356 stop:1541 length:186 start_codon:yes stop_codon:yes gene_type:complete
MIDCIAKAEGDLSNEAKAGLGSMPVCDQRIAQTALNSHAHVLKGLLPKLAVPKAKEKAEKA